MIGKRKKKFTVAVCEYKETETEFNEFERRFKFKRPLKYAWFHSKLYLIFQFQFLARNENRFWGDLNRGLNSLNSDTGD